MSHGPVPLAKVAIWAVLMLAFAGCGTGAANEDAGGSETRDGRLSLHDYTAEAEMICNEEMGRYDEIANVPGVEPTLEDIPPLMKQLAPVLKNLADRLSDLRPPQRVESDVDRMLSSFALVAADHQKVSEAEDTAEAMRRLGSRIDANFSRAHQIARRIGITNGCEGRFADNEDSASEPALPPQGSGNP